MQLLTGQSAQRSRIYAASQIRAHIAAVGLRPGDPLPSYRQLAQRLNVSLVTITRAMEDLTREGVLSCVDRKGAFVARQLAPSVRELRTIGLLFGASRPSLVEPAYRREFFYGLLKQADVLKADVQLFSFWSRGGQVLPKEVARICDGVIVLGAIRSGLLAEFAKEHIPMVVADFLSERLSLHHVVCDNAAMVQSAVAHLLANRHRELAYVCALPAAPPEAWSAPDSDHIERRVAFQAAARKHGASWRLVALPSPVRGRLPLDPLLELLAGRRRPTGLVVEETGLASKLIQGVETQTCLRVPLDISVVSVTGVAGESIMAGHTIAQNTMHFRDMGRRAVECLHQRCSSLRPTRRTVERIGADFEPGDTLGPAPAAQ